MPFTLTCAQGHQTTVADRPAAKTLRDCPVCGQPVTLTAASPAPPARGRSWMWLTGGAVVLVAGIVTTHLLFANRAGPPEPVKDREAARQVVVKFMELSKEGGDEGMVMPLLTDKAQVGYQRGENMPDVPKTRPGQTVEVGEAAVTGDTAEVPVTVREAGGADKAIFLVKRQGRDWKIYGMAVEFEPGNPKSVFRFDFENPKAMAKDMFGIDLDQMGNDFKNNMDAAFKGGGQTDPSPKAADRENEALAPLTRDAFEAMWKSGVAADAKPAKDVIGQLAEDLGADVKTTPVQDKMLARPVTVSLAGRSRPDLLDDVARRVGLVPVWGAPAGPKIKTALSFESAPRAKPLVHAGPFVVEVKEVVEYVPHATGRLTFRVTAPDLPPAVARLMRAAAARDRVSVTAITGPGGQSLTAGDASMSSGLVLDAGFEQTFDAPLKNLLKDVTAIKAVRGVIRVPLPTAVETLRFDAPAAGAVAKNGPVEVTLAQYAKQPGPAARVGLKLKGAGPARARVLAYDAQKKLIAVSPSSYSGSDDGGEMEVVVQGDAAALVVKLITKLETVEYPFAFADLPLPGAAGMPDKLVPAAFAGHAVPVSVEFVRVTTPGNFAKARFRVTNHADKAVRSLDVKLHYLDAAGKHIGEWFSVPFPDPVAGLDGPPPLAVEKSAGAEGDIRPLSCRPTRSPSGRRSTKCCSPTPKSGRHPRRSDTGKSQT